MIPVLKHQRVWELLVKTFRFYLERAAKDDLQSGLQLKYLDVDRTYIWLAAELIERAYKPGGYQDYLYALCKAILEPGGDDLKVQREKTLQSLARNATILLHEKGPEYSDVVYSAGKLEAPPDLK